jgi:hypothetical protein
MKLDIGGVHGPSWGQRSGVECGFAQELFSRGVVRRSVQDIDAVGVLRASLTSKPSGISVNRSLIASSYSESPVTL